MSDKEIHRFVKKMCNVLTQKHITNRSRISSSGDKRKLKIYRLLVCLKLEVQVKNYNEELQKPRQVHKTRENISTPNLCL